MQIRPLTPEDADRFVEFFSGPHFSHAPHWSGCFCRYYRAEATQDDWINRCPEDNRDEAKAEIRTGRMKGYLAFDGETCIGWCNANDASNYIRIAEDIAPYLADGKFGATLCFVIHPNYRGQGVARQILKRAVDDFKTAGFSGMLALPFDRKDAPQMRYRGTLNMYKELGYQLMAEDDGVFIMKLLF